MLFMYFMVHIKKHRLPTYCEAINIVRFCNFYSERVASYRGCKC